MISDRLIEMLRLYPDMDVDIKVDGKTYNIKSLESDVKDSKLVLCLVGE